MKYQLVLALLILGVVRSQYTCPKFSCGSVAGEDPIEVCTRRTASASEINYKLKLCNNAKTQGCNFKFAETTSNCTNFTTPAGSLLPGDPCVYPESCYSGVCRLGICMGREVGYACSVDQECTTGTYCNLKTKTCAVLAGQGAICGIEKGRCLNHLTCNMGVCVPVGSLTTGSPADNAIVCDTMYLAIDTDGLPKCSGGPKLKGYSNRLVECNIGDQCIYEFESGVGELRLPCKCGANADGKSYCHPGEGNQKNDVSLVWY